MTVQFLTLEEVCAKLRVSENTLRGLLRRGELKGGKVGAQWRIRSDDLEAFFDAASQAVVNAGEAKAEKLAECQTHQIRRRRLNTGQDNVESRPWEKYTSSGRLKN